MESAEKRNLSLHPDVIVFASYKKEVKEVIEFYKECGYKISIYSGGNQYAGYSSCQESIMNPCMQLGVSSIDNFVHNEENGQITLGVVLTMGEVHAKTVPLGITILMGIYKYVGVGGNFQSSASGLLVWYTGLGIYCVVSLCLVMANGNTFTAELGYDLYWETIEGYPGRFGVALYYTIQTLKDEY